MYYLGTAVPALGPLTIAFGWECMAQSQGIRLTGNSWRLATMPAAAEWGAARKPGALGPAKDVAGGGNLGQGRPLGRLAAWLMSHGDFPTKAAHFAWKPDLAYRAVARAWLRTVAGSEDLFSRERPRRDDEASEPDDLA